jgi:IPT/TIG domain
MRASAMIALVLAAACGDGGTDSGSNPAPVVTSLSPDTVVRGSAEATLSVRGSGFTEESVVRLNGTARPTEFVSAAQLRATLGAAELAAGAVRQVTVFTPAPGGGTSGAVDLVVANPVPEFTSLSLNQVAAGSAGAQVTITGANFFPETTVWDGRGNYAVTFVSPTELRVTLRTEDLGQPGSIILYISNPEPGGGSTNSSVVEIVNPAPTITALAPASVATRSAATVTVTGTGFLFSSLVYVANFPRQTFFVSPTQLRVELSPGDGGSAGTISFQVKNPAPGGGSSAVVPLEVRAPVPVVTSLLDATAPAGASSFVVYVSGSSFVDNSVVLFNGQPRPTEGNAFSQIHATLTEADLQTPGTFPITVFNPGPGGGVSNAVSFTVTNPAPTLSSLSPAFVPTGGAGATVTLQGTGFIPQSQALAEGSPRQTTYVSWTELRVALTAADVAPAGDLRLGVRNPAPGGGTSEEAALGLHAPVPVVTSLSPAVTPDMQSSLTLRVNGTGFASNSEIRFDLSPRPTRRVSPTQLETTIGQSDLVWARSVAIDVETRGPAGGISNAVDLVIRAPLPTITSLAATDTEAGQSSFILRVNGTGFRPTSTVRLNGAARPSSFLGATLMEVSLSEDDLRVPGSFAVTVATPAPGGGVSNAANFQVILAAPPLRAPSRQP